MTDLLTTNRDKAHGGIVFCLGCCCGRTDRGRPEVPVERLKAAWKAEKLNLAVQLTVSGCLGPCDVPNVAMILGRDGAQWLGRLAGDDCYDALIDWARACKAADALLPLPERFESHRLQRFASSAPEGV